MFFFFINLIVAFRKCAFWFKLFLRWAMWPMGLLFIFLHFHILSMKQLVTLSVLSCPSYLALKTQILTFKEARAGCVLKNWHREFCLIFAYVIFMLFRIYWYKKNIPHRDCSETGAISKYVSNIAFFVWNI